MSSRNLALVKVLFEALQNKEYDCTQKLYCRKECHRSVGNILIVLANILIVTDHMVRRFYFYAIFFFFFVNQNYMTFTSDVLLILDSYVCEYPHFDDSNDLVRLGEWITLCEAQI